MTHLGFELLDTGGLVWPVADAEDGVEYQSARAGLGRGGAVAALEIFPAVLNIRHQFSRSVAGDGDGGILTPT